MKILLILKTNIVVLAILGYHYEADAYNCPNKCVCDLDKNTDLKTVACSRLHEIPVDIDNETQSLNIRDSNISEISSASFDNLPALMMLRLASCNIQIVHPDAFKRLERLQDLSLYDNQIINLGTPRFLEGLRNLKSLNLQKNFNAQNSSSEYPDAVWSNVPKLEQLFIDGINNKTFPVGFSSLKKLSKLSLSGQNGRCSIQNLQSDIFTAFAAAPISHLDISYCEIEYLQPNVFTPLPMISVINMNNQDINDCNGLSILLSSLENSTISSLYLNSICRAGSFTFNWKLFGSLRFTSMKELYFENNFFSWVAEDFWEALPKTISTLSVEENYLFGGVFVGALLVTNLQHVRLTVLSSTLRSRPQIVVPLSLQYFSLNIVQFRGPLKLRDLNFSVNNLRSFALSGGTFEETSGLWTGLYKLQHLKISHTNLRNMTYGFFGSIPELQSIDISWNCLDDIIAGDKNGQLFEGARNVTSLDVSANRLRSIPRKLLTNIVMLKRLILHTNALTDFDVDISHLKGLEMLDLSRNEISSLASSVTDFLDTVLSEKTVINLQDNPLKCSCDTYQFIVWVQKRWRYFHAPNTYSCFLDNGSDAPFTRLDDIIADLNSTCESHMMIIILTSMALSLVTLITLGTIICKYRLNMIYLYYAVKRSKRVHCLTTDNEYPFDAFISFADEDLEFVKNVIVRNCEDVHRLKLCIHCRDFMPGTPITDNIANAVHFSRKTVFILSPDFLKSEWCLFEFNMARMEQLYSGRDVLLLVVYRSVTNGDLTLDMLEAKSKTYLTIPEDDNLVKLFVQRLTRSIRGEII